MVSYKITLLGDAAVGKTSLRKKFMGEGFQHTYGMTIGADFAAYRYNDYTLKIWDLAGQMRFNSVIDQYYIGTNGSLILFDITRTESFENVSNWIEQLTKNLRGDIVPMVLVGNKTDLRDEAADPVKPKIPKNYARELSDWAGFEVPYFETSALTGEKVDEAFEFLIKQIDEQTGMNV